MTKLQLPPLSLPKLELSRKEKISLTVLLLLLFTLPILMVLVRREQERRVRGAPPEGASILINNGAEYTNAPIVTLTLTAPASTNPPPATPTFGKPPTFPPETSSNQLLGESCTGQCPSCPDTHHCEQVPGTNCYICVRTVGTPPPTPDTTTTPELPQPTCTSWRQNGCGEGSCPATSMLFTRTCDGQVEEFCSANHPSCQTPPPVSPTPDEPNLTPSPTSPHGRPTWPWPPLPLAWVMQISNSPEFAGAQTEPFAETKTWTLTSGDGVKTVYARFAPRNNDKDDDLSTLGRNAQWTQPISDSIVLDTTAPDTQIISGPVEGEGVRTNSVTFTFSGHDNSTPPPPTTPSPSQGLTLSYKLDNSDWSNFSPSTTATFNNLGNGPHTFYVRARDAAGNVDPSPAQRNFTVALSEPQPTIIITPTPTPVGPGQPTPTTVNLPPITAEPTPTLTLTSTPIPGQALLTFRATLEGRGTDRNAAQVRLIARNKNFKSNHQTDPRGGKSGHLIELPQDKFRVGETVTFLAKTCGYLQARRDILLQSGENSIDFDRLRAGDILGDDAFGGEIGDNEVNVLDYSKLISLFEGSESCADFNGDDLVEVLDYSLMLNNFDVQGEVMEK